MYAIIKTGGKQYKVQEGDTIFVEKLNVENGAEVEFDALLVGDGESVKVGAPIVDGVKVKAKVDSVVKGKKIIVFKYKPKKGYRRKQGHRQPYTKVTIGKISV